MIHVELSFHVGPMVAVVQKWPVKSETHTGLVQNSSHSFTTGTAEGRESTGLRHPMVSSTVSSKLQSWATRWRSGCPTPAGCQSG